MALSWLQVTSKGQIVDAQNNPVCLRGVNTAGLEYGDGQAGYTQARINAVTSKLNANLWRLCVNVAWWNSNVLLTDGSTHYQSWIQQIIAWIEAAGCYVEINPTTYCTILPANSGPFCDSLGNPPSSTNCIPQQDTLNNPPSTQAQMVASTQAFYQSFIPLYHNDPAILYNALNEPGTQNAQFTDPIAANKSVIATIRSLQSASLIFVYAFSYDQIVSGSISNYTQSGLAIDWHIYDDPGNPWSKKFSDDYALFLYAQAHAQAISVGEWNVGGSTFNPQAYADRVASQVFAWGGATAYYNDGNLLNSDNVTLTAEGNTVASEFAKIAANTKRNQVVAGKFAL